MYDFDHIPLKELPDRRACKYAVGYDKGVVGHYLFCGRPSADTYCEEHEKVVFNPNAPRILRNIKAFRR